MIRLYYNPTTGEILGSCSQHVAQDIGTYIDNIQDINISQWRVNVETLELEAITPPTPMSRIAV